MRNPDLKIAWPAHCDEQGCSCGARYADFRLPGLPRAPGKRLSWAKRQIRPYDRDADVYWSLRMLLWCLRYLKATEFIAIHGRCIGEG